VQPFSSVLPIRADRPLSREFFAYIAWLAGRGEVVLIDRSPAGLFTVTHSLCPSGVVHARPDGDLMRVTGGRAASVLTGMRRATCDAVIVADDDIRYDERALQDVIAALDHADVVLPQNHFAPMPWHAWLDTGRALVNRATGGDWPATLGVRRSAILRAHGYDGDVGFESLELVRTVVAAGGRAARADAIFVRRLPPPASHFWAERLPQTFEDLAQPPRLAIWLALLPLALVLARLGHAWWIAAALAVAIVVAEAGRRRAGPRRVFPATASFAAAAWMVERSVSAWFALFALAFRGGIAYRGARIRRAATPLRELRRRFGRQLVS
jgi:hypothetical protein